MNDMKRFAICMMALLGVCVFTACDSENGGGDVIWDIAPVQFDIFITDDLRHDLLDSTYQGNLIKDISATYQGEEYPLITEQEYFEKIYGEAKTRMYMPQFYGLMLRHYRYWHNNNHQQLHNRLNLLGNSVYLHSGLLLEPFRIHNNNHQQLHNRLNLLGNSGCHHSGLLLQPFRIHNIAHYHKWTTLWNQRGNSGCHHTGLLLQPFRIHNIHHHWRSNQLNLLDNSVYLQIQLQLDLSQAHNNPV